MAAKKIKLSVEAKSVLLEQRMLPKNNKNQDELRFSRDEEPHKFLQFLIISKSFLRLSQMEKFSHPAQSKKICKFEISRFNDGNFQCKFITNNMDFAYSPFILTAEKLQKLVRFADPTHVEVNLLSMKTFEAAEAFKKVLEPASGKIDLISAGAQTKTVPLINILLKKYEQICGLECLAEILGEIGLVPQLNLDSCRLERLESYHQLNVILQHHNIKDLIISFDDKYDRRAFKLGYLSESFAPVPSVVGLEFNNSGANKGLDDDGFLQKTAKLVVSFPSLKHFKCYLVLSRRQFTSTSVYNAVIKVYNDSRIIQQSVKLGTKLEFRTSVLFYLENINQFLTEWHDQLKEHPAFANSQNIETSSKSIDFIHRIIDGNFEFFVYVQISHSNPLVHLIPAVEQENMEE